MPSCTSAPPPASDDAADASSAWRATMARIALSYDPRWRSASRSVRAPSPSMSNEKRSRGCSRRCVAASSSASSTWRPSTNWRPSSWIARTVAATTVFAPRRSSNPGGSPTSGNQRLANPIALDDSAASRRCGESPSPSPAKSARPNWSAVSAIAVSASGTRSSASARRISARPSALLIGYSRSSDSSAQNGAGLSRTACTHGAAWAAAADQSSRPDSDCSNSPTMGASSRYGDGSRAFIGRWLGAAATRRLCCRCRRHGAQSLQVPTIDCFTRCCRRHRSRADGAAATRRSTPRTPRPAPAARRRPARARSAAAQRAGGRRRRSRPAR